MAKVQRGQHHGATVVPVSPADVYGSSHAVRMAVLQHAIREKTQLPALTGTGSGAQQVIMPTAGLLRRARMNVSGTVTPTLGGGTVTLSKDGLYKFFSSIYFKDAANQTRITNLNGWSLYAAMANNTKSGHDPSFATVSSAQGSSIYKATSSISAATTFAFFLDLPFTWSRYDLRGLCNLNSAGRQAQWVNYLTNSLASTTTDFGPYTATGAATLALTDIQMDPILWTYTMTAQQKKGNVSVPIPHEDLQIVQELTSNTIAPVSGQDNWTTLIPGRSIQKIYQRLFVNGSQEPTTFTVNTQATAGGWNRIKFRYDNRATPIDIPYGDYLRDYRDEMERDFNGILWDFTDRPWDSILTPQLQVGGSLNSGLTVISSDVIETTVHAMYRAPVVNVAGVAV